MENHKELDTRAPTAEMLGLWGSVIYVWAMFDFISTGVFCTVLGIDAVETGITIGRLEPEAKIEKCRKIFLHRNKNEDASLLKTIRDFAQKAKQDRNAIAHARYLGLTDKGEWLFSFPSDFLVGDGRESATEIYVIHPQEMAGKIHQLQLYSIQLLERYGGTRLIELQSLPVRPRSLTPPKQPLNQNPKKQPPPPQSSEE